MIRLQVQVPFRNGKTMNEISSVKRNRAGRPTREQAKARQAKLLDCAAEHFLERGFEKATVEAIAADMNMTKRTIYARYASKEELFEAALCRAIEKRAVPQEKIEATRTDDLAQTLTNIAMQRINLLSDEQGLKLQRLIEIESFRFPDIFHMAYRLHSGPTIRFIQRVLDEENAAGRLAISDTELAANTFMSMVVGGPVRFITSGNPLPEHELQERVAFAVDLFLQGAKPR